MSGAVRLSPSHEREYVKPLGYVREYDDDEASRAQERKSRRCRAYTHTPENVGPIKPKT